MCIVHCALCTVKSRLLLCTKWGLEAIYSASPPPPPPRISTLFPPDIAALFSPSYLYSICPLISLFYFSPSCLYSLLYFPFISLSTVFSQSSVSPPPPHISTLFSLYLPSYLFTPSSVPHPPPHHIYIFSSRLHSIFSPFSLPMHFGTIYLYFKAAF